MPALLGHLNLTGLTTQRDVTPFPDLLAVFLGHAEHLGDHIDREQGGEILHHVEVIGVGRRHVAVDRLGHHRSHVLDGSGREDLVHQAAHVPVLGRVHDDDHFHGRRFVRLQHRQVEAVGRRVRSEVLEGHRDVLVPGERVEVVLLVVIDRGFFPHPPVELVRPVEEVLGERIEDEFGSGHSSSMEVACRGHCRTASFTCLRSPG